MDEQRFINLLRTIAPAPESRGLEDDCAVFGEMVLTHDQMIEGVHYFPDADPADVAWKLVARNLSDLAAKGAAPLGVLLGYTLGEDAWDARFAAGLREVLSHYETNLWGGDTAAHAKEHRGSPRTLGMTAIGRAAHLPVPSRSGARAGDTLWIAGVIGDAWLGFSALTGQPAPHSPTGHAAFHRPTPCLSTGRTLAPQVTAMMDISDGVLLDAARLARASGLTAAITQASLPFPLALVGADRALQQAALRFGDDYALLFTLPAGATPPVPATQIGKMQPADPRGPLLLDGAAPAGPLGWQHS